MSKTIWVTGAGGFLAGYVSRCFHNAGWQVFGLSRAPVTEKEQIWRCLTDWQAGLISHGLLQDVLEKQSAPDVIFHAAGGSSVQYSFDNPQADQVNTVQTTADIIEFIQDQQLKTLLILPSSAAVYGNKDNRPIAETDLIAPVSPYGRHKRMAEILCEQAAENSSVSSLVIRYFSIYGAGLRKQLLWDMIRKALSTTEVIELFGTGNETRDMLHAEDAARMALYLCNRHSGDCEIFNGGTGVATTVNELAVKMLRHINDKLQVKYAGKNREGDPLHYQADITRLQQTGFSITRDLDAGLAEYSRWAMEELTHHYEKTA